MKKTLAILLALVMSIALLAACADPAPTPAPTTPETPEAPADEELYIAVISKGFQHQFWQAVYEGSRRAAADYGVRITFEGPESEADIHVQVEMVNTRLGQNPAGIALAALATDSLLEQLQAAYDRNIPVVGFDSGIPDAPAGQVRATASTNNQAAAAIGADQMFPEIEAQLAAATSANPAVVVVLSQDAVSESITGRTQGFAERMFELAGGVNDSVAIVGGLPSINTGDANAAVQINVVVGATPSTVDMTTAATGVLTMPGLVGVFCSNEGAAVGMINAILGGGRVPDGVQIVGFDAGTAQKDAVRAGYFMGAITQDPVQIGYQAVSLAVRAIRGENVSDIDTGARWWDSNNMDDPEIAILLYD